MMKDTGTILIRLSPDTAEISVEQEQNGIISRKNLTPETLAMCFLGSRFDDTEHSTGLLPSNCIAATMTASGIRYFIRYPHRSADISYYGTEYTDFPLPQLVFSMRYDPETHKAMDIRLCVVKDEHLTPDTPTYHYPFSNVYGDKRICLGNNALPQYKDPTKIGGLAYHILHMPNNNDMYKSQHNKLGLEYRELLEYLKDKDPACYYSEILVPDGKTLKHFIGGK